MKRVTLLDLRMAAERGELRNGLTLHALRLPRPDIPEGHAYVAALRDGEGRPLGVICNGERGDNRPKTWTRPDFILTQMDKIAGPALAGMLITQVGPAGAPMVALFIAAFQLDEPDLSASDAARAELLATLRGCLDGADA